MDRSEKQSWSEYLNVVDTSELKLSLTALAVLFSPLVREHAEPGSQLSTDDWMGYSGLYKDYVHQIVDHAEEYVSGQVQTNGMENFWSLLKRGLKGTYVSVEPFHLFRYLDEQVFRYNNRATKKNFVSYQQLTGKGMEKPRRGVLRALRLAARIAGRAGFAGSICPLFSPLFVGFFLAMLFQFLLQFLVRNSQKRAHYLVEFFEFCIVRFWICHVFQ
jgi:hypothetical protein